MTQATNLFYAPTIKAGWEFNDYLELAMEAMDVWKMF